MTGRVPLYPPQFPGATTAANGVRIAAPVYGDGQWSEYGAFANWLIGRGSPLVIAGPSELISNNSSDTHRFYLWPHIQNFARIWMVTLAKTSGQYMSGTITLPDSSSRTWVIPEGTPPMQGILFPALELVDPPSGTAGGVEVTIAVDAAPDEPGIFPYAISCYEVPRATLADFGSVVVPDLDTLASGQLIYDPADDGSVPAVMRASVDALSEARRACLFSAYFPAGVTITDTAFDGTTNIFTTSGANDPPVVARHRHNAVTSHTIAWAAYVESTGTTPGGDLRVTSTSPSGSDTQSIPTGPAWITGTIAVETEDLSQAGGLRGGTRNPIIVEATRDADATNVTVYGFCMGETD